MQQKNCHLSAYTVNLISPCHRYRLSNEIENLPLEDLLTLYSQTYWAQNRPESVIVKSLQNALCYCLSEGDRLIGFLRLITDYATYAYLCDVIIHEDYRGKGLGKWMVGEALQHPEIQSLRRISLMTQDAQSLYAPFGFKHLSDPNRYMEKMKMEA